MAGVWTVSGVTKTLLGAADEKDTALLGILDRTAVLPEGELREQQLAQLRQLLAHAARHCPGYASRLAGLGAPEALDWERFAALPVLERSELQTMGGSLTWQRPLPAYAPKGRSTTSGSTGSPLTTEATHAGVRLARAVRTRFQRWHGFDPNAPMAFITQPKPGAGPPEGETGPGWAVPWGRGAAFALDLLCSTEEQLGWLCRKQPTYLATYPSNLEALLQETERTGQAPEGLESIVVSSEPVSDALVARTRSIWGARLLPTYSANEVGAIALAAPDGAGYLIQSESVFVEVLTEGGSPAEVGEVGRVVVTTLHDLRRPLIRYAIGDYAEVGPVPADSVIRLPRLTRILGRERSMVRLPDGRRVWPYFEFAPLMEGGVLRQWQLVQRRDLSIDAQVVARSPLSAAQKEAISSVVERSLPGIMVRVNEVASIVRTPRGKYPELITETE